MKIGCAILFLILSIFTAAAGEDFKFPLYKHVTTWGTTNWWFIPMSDFDKKPKWDEHGEPPLLPGKAIALAKGALVSLGGDTNSWVGSVEFRTAAPGEPPSLQFEESKKFRSFWFYVIGFQEVFTVGSHSTCIVFMDGSVEWPEVHPLPKNPSIQDYLD